MSCILCDNEECVKIEDKLVCYKHLSLIHSLYEVITDGWDRKICATFSFGDSLEPPSKNCLCGYPKAIPFDYYISGKGDLVLCCICKNCLGYKEVSDSQKFPMIFKEAPWFSGIDTVLSGGESDPDFYG